MPVLGLHVLDHDRLALRPHRLRRSHRREPTLTPARAQAEVERRRRVGQRADRDHLDPGRRDRGDVRERDPARCLELRRARRRRLARGDRRAQRSRRPCCRAGACRRRRRAPRRPRRASRHSTSTSSSGWAPRGELDRASQTARDRDVVLLDQDRVVEAACGGCGRRRRRPPPSRAPAGRGGLAGVEDRRAAVRATASTKRAVRVATPERWPSRLRAVRSAGQQRPGGAARRPPPRPGPSSRQLPSPIRPLEVLGAGLAKRLRGGVEPEQHARLLL